MNKYTHLGYKKKGSKQWILVAAYLEGGFWHYQEFGFNYGATDVVAHFAAMKFAKLPGGIRTIPGGEGVSAYLVEKKDLCPEGERVWKEIKEIVEQA